MYEQYFELIKVNDFGDGALWTQGMKHSNIRTSVHESAVRNRT